MGAKASGPGLDCRDQTYSASVMGSEAVDILRSFSYGDRVTAGDSGDGPRRERCKSSPKLGSLVPCIPLCIGGRQISEKALIQRGGRVARMGRINVLRPADSFLPCRWGFGEDGADDATSDSEK